MIFTRNKTTSRVVPSEKIGEFYFGQLHANHQKFFDKLCGGHNRVKLRDLPHYIFWRDAEYSNPSKSLYYKYLQESWKFYFPEKNTDADRLKKIDEYKGLKSLIQKEERVEPVSVVIAPDGREVLLDGNHRASIAYHLGMDLECEYRDLREVILQIVTNKDEFYGSKNAGKPYQSIFYQGKELVDGRRRDILERFKKMDIVGDIRGKRVADIGSNIAMSGMLAWHFGAKEVVAMEFSPKIASSALRLSTLLDSRITLKVRDMGKKLEGREKFDTVLCFSLHAHIKDKKGLEDNINAMTAETLYFEGHENSNKEDYQHIFRHFKKVELIEHNNDGIHSSGSTRPFFKCTR